MGDVGETLITGVYRSKINNNNNEEMYFTKTHFNLNPTILCELALYAPYFKVHHI